MNTVLTTPEQPTAPSTLRLGRHERPFDVVGQPAVRWALAAATGICLGAVTGVNIVAWFAVLVCAAPVCFLARQRHVATAAGLVMTVAAMASWQTVREPTIGQDSLAYLAPQQWSPAMLQATVATCVERRPSDLLANAALNQLPPDESVFECNLIAVRNGLLWQPLEGRVMVISDGDLTHLLIGDTLTIRGQWCGLTPPSNPGEFDSRPLFAQRGIGARVRVDDPLQISLDQTGAYTPWRLISWISARGDAVLRKYVGERGGALAAALVLGRRRAVDPETRDRLVETGTAHLLSVSGLHLAMVAALFGMLLPLTGWRRGTQIGLIVMICVFYAALTGARPPVLRASMLVAAVLLASHHGRRPNVLNSLALAALVLMVVNPELLFETGTQLSFLAVITLVITGQTAAQVLAHDLRLEELAERQQNPLIQHWKRATVWFGQSARISFWMWLVTLPLIWNAYNIIAPVSVLANVLMMIPLSLSLVLGLITTAVGLIAGPSAAPFGYACRLSVELLEWIVNMCAAIPAGHWWFPAPPTWWVGTFYAVIGFTLIVSRLFSSRWQPNRRTLLFGSIVWFGIACFLPAPAAKQAPPENALVVTFIDVGHGTSVLIQLPEQQGTWLYDAGRMGDPQWSSASIESVLWFHGIHHLDGVVISHADADHYNAVPKLLRRFQIDRLFMPAGLLTDEQPGLIPFRLAVEQWQTPVVAVAAGDSLVNRNGEKWSDVLHPPSARLDASDNANSVVLQLSTTPHPLILPGDLESPGTAIVLGYDRPLPGGVLMAPHHGSLNQDATPMLQWSRPSLVIVSGGERAARIEVEQMLSANGADVAITAKLGAIQVRMHPNGSIERLHWHENQWVPIPSSVATQ